MNIENIRAVRDLVASRPAEAINMSGWGYGIRDEDAAPTLCGTSGCIAGWTNVQKALKAGGGKFVQTENELGHKYIVGFAGFSDADSAAEFLGLDAYYSTDGCTPNSRVLFHMKGGVPFGLDFFYTLINRDVMKRAEVEAYQKDAVIAVLDELIETGKVNWPGVLRRLKPAEYDTVQEIFDRY